MKNELIFELSESNLINIIVSMQKRAWKHYVWPLIRWDLNKLTYNVKQNLPLCETLLLFVNYSLCDGAGRIRTDILTLAKRMPYHLSHDPQISVCGYQNREVK